MNFDFTMAFYGALIGLGIAYVAYRIGSNIGNTFYDVVDAHLKNKFQKKL
jgi:hypothetical protein